MTDINLSRYTDSTKKALELALREALSLGHNYVGTEHVFLTLIRPETGSPVVLAAFERMGLDPDQVRAAVMDVLVGERTAEHPTREMPEEGEGEGETETPLKLARKLVDRELTGPNGSPRMFMANAADVVSALALLAIAEALSREAGPESAP